MFKDVIDNFKMWMTCDGVNSLLTSISKTCDALCAGYKSLDSRVNQLESAEKSRAEAVDFIASSTEPVKPVCDDCISMRLEMNALRNAMDETKARLEVLEVAKKNGSDGSSGQANNVYTVPTCDKPKLRRRKNDARELVA